VQKELIAGAKEKGQFSVQKNQCCAKKENFGTRRIEKPLCSA